MPTVSHSCPVHRRANGLFLRVDVALRDVHVAVPTKLCQRPGVHVRCPARQACVPQRVQLESVKFYVFPLSQLAEEGRSLLNSLGVLLL
jgi:hypothetical protein